MSAVYRVAVCEDDPALCEETAALCRRYLETQQLEHEVVTFGRADALRTAVLQNGERFDLVCLDILMPGENGMQLAQDLRAGDERVSILFISSATEFLQQGYSVRPIQFLLKPLEPAALEQALADDLRLHHRARSVAVTVGGKTTVLPLQDICYVESRDHGCAFILEEGERFFWLTMREAEQLLPAEQFCRCHNSFLVNLGKVVRTDSHSVQLQSGVQLPVSRRWAMQFQSMLTRFLNRP